MDAARSTIVSETKKRPIPFPRGKYAKTFVMYCTMVTVSTAAIFVLEHATLFNAFRTATVAAIAKTFAANWVTGLFE